MGLAALRRGGIRLLEVTADTPGAIEAVRRAHDERTPIGTGTIRTRNRLMRSRPAEQPSS